LSRLYDLAHPTDTTVRDFGEPLSPSGPAM
jgi:hypothetical protein